MIQRVIIWVVSIPPMYRTLTAFVLHPIRVLFLVDVYEKVHIMYALIFAISRFLHKKLQ